MNATSQIVVDYLARWGGLPSLTLAKKIYAENSDKFTNVESCMNAKRRAHEEPTMR